MIYILNTALIFIYNVFSTKIKSWKSIGLSLSFIMMTSIVIFRGSGIGADYLPYNQIYEDVIHLPFFEGLRIIDPGYALICYVSNWIDPGNTWLVHSFMGFLTMTLFYLSIKKISCNYCLSVYLFVSMGFLYNIMTQERQCFAMALVAYGLYYFINKMKVKFLLLLLIAGTFHTSALIMLLLFIPEILQHFRQSKILMTMFIVVSLYCLYSVWPIKAFLQFFNITRFLPYLTYNSSLQLSIIANTLVRIIIIFFVFITYRKVSLSCPTSKVLYFMIALMFIFQIGALKIALIARITTYFYMSLIYLVPIIFQEIDIRVGGQKVNKYIELLLLFVLIPYHYVYFLFQYTIQSNALVPYYSIFDNFF